jgi:hypothetical protein
VEKELRWSLMSEGDRVDDTEVRDNSETITAAIVEIDGNRLITEMESGNHLCFSLKALLTPSTSVTSWN